MLRCRERETIDSSRPIVLPFEMGSSHSSHTDGGRKVKRARKIAASFTLVSAAAATTDCLSSVFSSDNESGGSVALSVAAAALLSSGPPLSSRRYRNYGFLRLF